MLIWGGGELSDEVSVGWLTATSSCVALDRVRVVRSVQNNSRPSVNFRAFTKIDRSFPQAVGHYVLAYT